MILNSLAMEFLMSLDNEFEELYFQNLPGAADDIYDNIYVTYETNKKLINKQIQKKKPCYTFTWYLFYIPYKLLVLIIFLFPFLCFFVSIIGPICK